MCGLFLGGLCFSRGLLWCLHCLYGVARLSVFFLVVSRVSGFFLGGF